MHNANEIRCSIFCMENSSCHRPSTSYKTIFHFPLLCSIISNIFRSTCMTLHRETVANQNSHSHCKQFAENGYERFSGFALFHFIISFVAAVSIRLLLSCSMEYTIDWWIRRYKEKRDDLSNTAQIIFHFTKNSFENFWRSYLCLIRCRYYTYFRLLK